MDIINFKMNAEKLIEEIRKFPVLYDQSNEKYRHNEYKERVWQMIATTLNFEGGVEECKTKWASIRDQLRRTLQKRKRKSSQAPRKIRKYKYEDMLTFLLPHLEIEGVTNVSQVGDEEDECFDFSADSQDVLTRDTNQEETFTNVDEQHTEEVRKPIVNNNDMIMPPSSPSANQVSANRRKSTISTATKRKARTREVKTEDSQANQLMAYILTKKEAENEKAPTCNQDPVDAFLYGIAPTLKSLNPILLNEAKGRIFSIVQELELKQLHVDSQQLNFMPNYLT